MIKKESIVAMDFNKKRALYPRGGNNTLRYWRGDRLSGSTSPHQGEEETIYFHPEEVHANRNIEIILVNDRLKVYSNVYA